jgi:hypothetical protein
MMKRVLRNVQDLPVNSTLHNLSLPYFTVDKFKWLADPQSTLTPAQPNIFNVNTSPASNRYNPGFSPAAPIMDMIRDDLKWGPVPGTDSRILPSPQMISEARILVRLGDFKRDAIALGRSAFFKVQPQSDIPLKTDPVALLLHPSHVDKDGGIEPAIFLNLMDRHSKCGAPGRVR